jgi:hypothetical protein
MKLKVPSKNYGITELYDTVAFLMGKETKDLNYDCRCINVAPNIQDMFFAHYQEENSHLSESEFKMGMAMMLLNYGPKVNENLTDNEVEVFDGFIC